MSQQPKKLIVTLRKSNVLPSPDFYDVTWATLLEFVRAVHAMRHTDFSFEQLFQAVTNLVMAKHGAKVYANLVAEIDSHIGRVLDNLDANASQDPAAFLAALHAAWVLHSNQNLLLKNVFLYLDTTYVRDTPGAKTIWETGTSQFRFHLLARPDFLSKVVDCFLVQISVSRSGGMVDTSVLSALTRMLTVLKLYASHLEPPLLRETREYYASEGTQRIAECDIPQYCLHVLSRLREERERCVSFLDAASTLRPVLDAMDSTLISAHVSAILDRGFLPLVDGHRVADLKRMYYLVGRVGRTDDMRKCFSEYCKKRTAEIVAFRDEEKDKLMVQTLLDFRDAVDGILVEAFDSNDGFAAALKSAFEFGINSRESKPAELIAKFMDAKMRGGARALSLSAPLSSSSSSLAASSNGASALSASFLSSTSANDASRAASAVNIGSLNDPKSASLSGSSTGSSGATASGARASGGGVSASTGATAEEELERILDKAMILFRCIHGKDVFEAFYKKDLAKRLLLGKSASMDAEKQLVARLKAECGSQFTSKLEGMFKDVEGSESLMAQFNAQIPRDASAAAAGGKTTEGSPFSLDLHVHVLTSAYWPAYPPLVLQLPSELVPPMTAFESFYVSKFSKGRRLQWQHSLGHCLMRAHFPCGRKELDVSFFQALVLLMFNAADAVPFRDIKARSGLEDGELRRTLQSLACGQVRVLRKEPKGRDVGDDDVFHYNAEFKAPLIRIKINTIQMKETQQEADATNDRVMQDRLYQVDAAIVRIMKTRKTMQHQSLLTELFAHLRFPAKAADIKRRIESLIDRDYLERDERDAQTYRYLV